MKQAADENNGDMLVTLANAIAAFPNQPDMTDAARRVIGLTQKAAPWRTQEVAQALIRASTPSYAPYVVRAAALDAAAPLEPGVKAFIANRHEANEVLRTAIAHVPAAEVTSQKLRLRLARVMWQIGDEKGLYALVQEVAAEAIMGNYDPTELSKLALICLRTQHESVLHEAIAFALHREPQSAEILHAYLRIIISDLQTVREWWPRLREVASDHPQDASLERFIAHCAYELSEWAFAEQIYQNIAQKSSKPVDWERAGLAALRMGHEENAAKWLSRARPRIDRKQLGRLETDLDFLLLSLNRDYYLDDDIDHQSFGERLAASCTHVRQALASNTYLPNELIQAASAISTVERYPFYVLSQIIKRDLYVERWDARYGTFDLLAYGIVWQALMEHQLLLLDYALKRMIQGSAIGTLNGLRETAKQITEVSLALNQPAVAIDVLESLISSGCNGLFFEDLADQCLLHQGNIDAVERRVRARPLTNKSERITCRVSQIDEWILREKVGAHLIWEEGRQTGHFEKARGDGRIDVHSLELGPFKIFALGQTRLTLAASEVLIGPHGSVLRPSHWHYPGVFPQRTGIALSAALNGAILNLHSPSRQINEPVVVLACNDSVHVANYFHWIYFILTRCVFLLEQGLLKGRRLLMPAELQPWMRGALDLVGLTEDRLLSYNAQEVVHIAEATVITAFDYPGAEYLRRFRSYMWNVSDATSGNDSAKGSGHIFMARPNIARRPFFGRERILQLAEEEGFSCIDPAKLSVAEQVRLFAKANSVAGFGGAAFTNMAFCRTGMPALELTRRETTWPDFIGVALALGIQFRFCPGWIDPSARGTRLVHDGPTRFSENMVTRELKRLKDVEVPH